MTKQEAKEFILKIAYDIGTTAMDYWGIETREKLIEAVNALEEPNTGTIIPDNATNGDMVKTMFPHYDIEVDEHKGYVRIFYSDFYTTYPLEWWNAPYKREEE